ncbi:MAG: hypothetical protein WC679_00260 [Bacteroidales bacterium]|jgi:hypothetical protein
MNWKPIDKAPWKKTVLLKGNSGYCFPHDIFIINGYRVKDWHQGEWNDVTGTRLSDSGWVPEFWTEIDE